MLALQNSVDTPSHIAVLLAWSLIQTGESDFSRPLVAADFQEALNEAQTDVERIHVAQQRIDVYMMDLRAEWQTKSPVPERI